MNYYFGVDPGKHGGIALIIYEKTIVVVEAYAFDDISQLDIVKLISNRGSNVYGYIEMVTGSVGESDKGRATRMFTFGEHYGLIQGMFIGRVKLEKVAPTTWQRGLGIKKIVGEKYEDRKRRLKVEARVRFPEIKVTKAIADALLIAYWGCMNREGKLLAL